MLAVALILSIIHKERIAPTCDITELMAIGIEKWQNHIMALEDCSADDHAIFTHISLQNTWPCLLSTDLRERGSEMWEL